MPDDDKKAGDSRPIISLAEDGPLVVKKLATLLDARGASIEVSGAFSLCRCGYSRSKPFCDGTHSKTDFRDERLTDSEWDFRESYAGDDITIHDNRGICSHAGHCTDGLPSVWKMDEEPWIDPDGAEADEIIEVVRRCPSGALSYSVDGVEHRDQDREPAIRIAPAGPYQVVGGVELEVPDERWGEKASREHFTLCRCGRSSNKPFCDGTHWYVDFQDPGLDGRAGSATEQPGEDRELVWHRVAGLDEIADGRVKTASAGTASIALTRLGDEYGALDNRCPHQGGPLGEGSIEDGRLRCPWHGWDFDPLSGEGFRDDTDCVATYPVDVREDGVYVGVEEAVEEVRTVSDVMVDEMVEWGVTHVFGMVGHSNLGLAEAIRLREESGDLTYIGVRHEGAASFACSAFAKLAGRPAACLSIAGPGATNLLTGLWDARMDRAPVLALTGQVNTQVLGPGAFQEIDLASAFEAVAAFSQTVLPESDHAELMALALKNAVVQRNVGHLIFPDEVQVLPMPGESDPAGPRGRVGPVAVEPPDESLGAAVERLRGAKRPVIVVGYGAREAMEPVVELAGRLECPVLTTFKAKGQMPDDHPLAAGVLGRSGTPIASWFMNEADLLVVFGASFAHHTGIESRKPIIQVDFDRMALGKFHAVDVPVWGEIGVTARRLLDALPAEPGTSSQVAEIAERWELWREEKAKRRREDRGRGVDSASVFDALSRKAPEDAVIAVDVGNNTYSFGRYFECKRQSVLMSGYLGSIGFGLPAAIGAWAAAPDRPILAVCGDGGFGQYLGEFTTAVKYGMTITVVLLDNQELGKISKEQRAGEWPVWQTSLTNPDFARFADNCGGKGLQVRSADDLDDALDEAFANEGPTLVHVLTDAELI